MTTTIENGLAKTVAEFQLSAELQDKLIQTFGPMFADAKTLADEAAKVSVTDVSQTAEMRRARELRIKLRDVRVLSDKARKELKEEFLRPGQAVDKVAKVIALVTEPAEAKLDEMEKFAERTEAKRRSELAQARREQLRAVGGDAAMPGLDTMSDETFELVLSGTKRKNDERIAAEKKAAEERAEAERKAQEERERIRVENERLKAEATKREAEAKAERDRLEAEARVEREKAAQAQREADRIAREAQQAAEEAKREAERIARQAREEAERVQREADRKRKEEEAAKRRAEAAPDAEKLIALAAQLEAIQMPNVASDEAADHLVNVRERLVNTATYLRDAAESIST